MCLLFPAVIYIFNIHLNFMKQQANYDLFDLCYITCLQTTSTSFSADVFHLFPHLSLFFQQVVDCEAFNAAP